MAPEEVWFPAAWVDILKPFSSDPKQEGKSHYRCEKRLRGGKKRRKKNPNKETFLFNPKGYFLAFSSLGKARLGVRAARGGKGFSCPLLSLPAQSHVVLQETIIPRGRCPLGVPGLLLEHLSVSL